MLGPEVVLPGVTADGEAHRRGQGGDDDRGPGESAGRADEQHRGHQQGDGQEQDHDGAHGHLVPFVGTRSTERRPYGLHDRGPRVSRDSPRRSEARRTRRGGSRACGPGGHNRLVSIEPDTKDWTWVIEQRLRAVRVRPGRGRPRAACRPAAREHPRLVRHAGRRRLRRTPGPARVVAPGVRLPRPRRPPDLRRAGAADARRGRPASSRTGTRTWPPTRRTTTCRTPATSGPSWSSVPPRPPPSTPRSTGDQWQRTGRRSNGSAFTVESIGRYHLHDVVHHLWDVSITPAPPAPDA